ncbi:sodium/potassium-transporting ATPase subunit beta-1-interacting protein isoform X3 [Cylas formicarius]|uniref:sodium/potassium-transporting ATPase subunit beta-1-interacting protein isoform X3 n=1 Tax=Cylas formicarius TaxID=197179 RepID=UPI00295890E4|nr:sodium/potassium-transporting ATPase subunit beta-1-interacting protein isoform X3 [Cylas formicarius]
MGFCTRRHLFLTICVLQMITVVERQVFDFLGFLWVPILVNFFQIIFIIFGFFGAYQYRPKYIIAYLLWHLFWIAWNTFLICLYLNIAGLDHDTNKVLKLDPTSDSWWKKEGPGCKIVNVDEIPLVYEGCFLDYIYIEVFHAGLQCFFAMFSCVVGVCLSRTFLEEDDTFNFEKADGPDNFLLQPIVA